MSSQKKPGRDGIGTRCIHGGQHPDPSHGAVMPPIVTASTFVQQSPGVPIGGYEYSRAGNPTRTALERMAAALEGSNIPESADASCGGFAFASGMAAMATALDLLDAGSKIIAMDDLYGGSGRLFSKVREQSQGLRVLRLDMSDATLFERAMTPDTKMVWVETPTNPMMKLVDLAKVAEIAKKANPDVILACDNTFATPITQAPFSHGFNLVVHSTTKYMNGHSDSIGGLLITNDRRLAERIRFLQKAVGAIMGPFDAYLTLRGIKTLQLRMQRHNDSGLRIARHLESHPRVKRVIYPGLESHPQHELAERQMCGHTGMVSFDLDGGLDEARRLLENCRIFALAESLGGVESLIEHPAIMTHASVPPEMRAELGISDSLIRLSVGIEECDDLIADLDQAIEAAFAGGSGAASSTPKRQHAPC